VCFCIRNFNTFKGCLILQRFICQIMIVILIYYLLNLLVWEMKQYVILFKMLIWFLHLNFIMKKILIIMNVRVSVLAAMWLIIIYENNKLTLIGWPAKRGWWYLKSLAKWTTTLFSFRIGVRIKSGVFSLSLKIERIRTRMFFIQ